jgi:diguanylate cyclase (GGDEF)-like protein
MADHQLRVMIARAEENERKLRRFEALELRLIGAESLGEVLRILLTDYRATFNLQATTVLLSDPGHELRRLLAGELGGGLQHLHLLAGGEEVQALAALGPGPHLQSWHPESHTWLFPRVFPAPASVAVLPLLRHRRPMGALCLGSSDPQRFTPERSTDFMQRFAQIAALCLENAIAYERLREVGLTDALTGAKNRRLFEQRLREEVSRVARTGEPLACLMLDIDHFKRVNDRHGHPAGDSVLQQVARRISLQLRTSDVLARYGGEEFAALLPRTDMVRALEVGERIRRAVGRDPCELVAGHRLPVTVSVGVAVLGPAGMGGPLTGEALVQRADQALYAAKQQGRNRVVSAR